VSNVDADPHAESAASATPATCWSLRRTAVIASLGWPLALGWHWVVNLLFRDEWRWGVEVGRAIFVWWGFCFAMCWLERRKRRSKPPASS
jgi:hypothetical protein